MTVVLFSLLWFCLQEWISWSWSLYNKSDITINVEIPCTWQQWLPPGLIPLSLCLCSDLWLTVMYVMTKVWRQETTSCQESHFTHLNNEWEVLCKAKKVHKHAIMYKHAQVRQNASVCRRNREPQASYYCFTIGLASSKIVGQSHYNVMDMTPFLTLLISLIT